MYIDRDEALRLEIAPIDVDMERGRLRFFAETIGLTDPVHLDREAAKQAGHPDVVVPLTFLGNALELEQPDPLSWLTALGVDLSSTTHGEQAFTYHRLAYAGDTLTMRRSIADVYLKKSGALEFVVKKTEITRSDGAHIADTFCTIGIHHPEAAS